MNYNFLFPGQGSQKVGMGSDFYKEFDIAKKRIDEANAILDRDIKTLIFEGPEGDLTATQNTQPALFTIESLICDILKDNGIEPCYCLGHSLGEYSALYASGVFSFADGLRLVAKRGELMAQAGKETKGAMAVIVGLENGAIAEVLQEVKNGVVVSANENSPEQTVISGELAAVKEACKKLKSAGARRALLLPVSGAFHSPLMLPVNDKFSKVLETIQFNNAQYPVITNVTAQPQTNKNEIIKQLNKHLLSPVRWVDSMAFLISNGALSSIEIGPGTVLKKLAKKCNNDLNVVQCETVENLISLLNS